MASDKSWKKIFEHTGMDRHDFDAAPYELSADQIKAACQEFTKTAEKEVRILCKQDERNSRPQIFKDKGLFILPKHNGSYYILKGEGYIDVPDITSPIQDYHKKLDFELLSSEVGDSEMQHLDYAYANSLIRTFMGDESLVLTIRGRKYTPTFTCKVNNFTLEISSVQTEVDAGYEGKDKIVLIEAKNSANTDTIIRQLYFPYRQWQDQTGKTVYPLFFEKRIINNEKIYYIWQFEFTNKDDYNSIRLVKSARYRILPKG
ncbi:MAG: hypothetical protein IKN59_03140 [Paludibacteraceae bacterium]|nr:hypothetical protein [Paludibacteraceae bacterium]